MSGEAILVVGSGPSGVHFAATLLEKGYRVRMLDVGNARPEPIEPELSLDGLKRELPDPRGFFLGDDWEALVLNDSAGEYYGFPPGKQYVFTPAEPLGIRTQGFEPLFSHAAGGLAEAWTGGSYPFDDRDLADWMIDCDALAPYYGRVAERIGISGAVDDDLAQHFPVHAGIQPALELDRHSALLLERYAGVRDRWQRANARLGRSRVATLSQPLHGRQACHRSGRCQWGCPTDAFYTPSVTLRECRENERFEYLPDHYVTHLALTGSGAAAAAVARRQDGSEVRFEANRVVLAAGTLPSARIVLESIARSGDPAPELVGLMDNRQVLMPFVNLRLLGRPFDSESYQYHQLALGFDPGGARDYVHGLITTLTTALVHPVVQALPFSMRTSLGMFRNIHAALALLNLNFADDRRPENRVGLEPVGDGSHRMVIAYQPASDEAARMKRSLKSLRRLLLSLGCVAPPPMTRARPMGASVHYAGTFPMCEEGGDYTTDRDGRLRAFGNVWLADGSSFPSLPAKNLTFTLMANATRIAEEAF